LYQQGHAFAHTAKQGRNLAATPPVTGLEFVPFTREKTPDGAILFCTNSAYDTACDDQTVEVMTKGAEVRISVSRPQSQPIAMDALPVITHTGDRTPVQTRFMLDDDLVNAPFAAHRTTRGLALVFSLLPLDISTGPERHTAVPKVYVVGGALGSLQIKAFGSSRGTPRNNSEKSTTSGNAKQRTGETGLPVDLFRQGPSSSVVPLVRHGETKRKATTPEGRRSKKKHKQNELLEDDEQQKIDPEEDDGDGENGRNRIDIGDFVVCREEFDAGKEGVSVYRIDGPAEDQLGYSYYPYTQFATTGRGAGSKPTSRKVLKSKFNKVVAGEDQRLGGYSVIAVFPEGLINHVLPDSVQAMIKSDAVWKLMSQ
jgi:hypothetical protein